ncbi:Bin/amphiphysin/Rvs domain for vesicular trafficking-domain-containing protein [Cokeromyces recurvatus]|uniref:Bin/amphiphysin/Rvs domain for vesicular trafficking-domain-containing protein n=1 Tax=Cokeromyces recurvatus TaxID=90255 RepID=UPI00221FB447|nr:Bin/amphiphysin/Rvs domain for vesicular trafficking-domain-containing protein [Cokeromyces recurvatus]KAI7900077.1 Bin/amphiphysin/Rvs domain for vesicular trafficking-domain-containing protein [Cokeromyces recurvatus]
MSTNTSVPKETSNKSEDINVENETFVNKKVSEEEKEMLKEDDKEEKEKEEDKPTVLDKNDIEEKEEEEEEEGKGMEVEDNSIPTQQNKTTLLDTPATTNTTVEQPSRQRSSSITPAALLESTLDSLASFSSKINPLTQRIGKGLGQVRQYAQEKLGTAEDITELPQEYKDLEKRVDTFQQIHQNFLKVTKTYNSPAYDYPLQLQESLKGFTNTVTNQIQQLTNKSDQQRAQTSSDHHPRTLSHAVGRVALEGAAEIGQDDAFGAALQKLGETSIMLGNARLAMDHAIVSKFNTPLLVSLKTTFENTNKARRQVQIKRLALDAAKTNYRESPTNKLDSARLQVEQAEDEFIGAVEEATHLMKALLEDVSVDVENTRRNRFLTNYLFILFYYLARAFP